MFKATESNYIGCWRCENLEHNCPKWAVVAILAGTWHPIFEYFETAFISCCRDGYDLFAVNIVDKPSN